MSQAIDEEQRLAEVRSRLRDVRRQESDAVRRLGGAVAAGQDPSPIHAELRAVREEAEGLVAATMLLDID